MKFKYKAITISTILITFLFLLVGSAYSTWFFNTIFTSEGTLNDIEKDDIKENYSFGSEDSITAQDTDVTIYVFPSTIYYDVYTLGYLDYETQNEKYTTEYNHSQYYYAENTPSSYKCLPEDKFGYITPILDDNGNVKLDSDDNPIFDTPIYKKASDGSEQVYPSATQIHRNKGNYYSTTDKTDYNAYRKIDKYYEIASIDELAYPKYIATTNYSHYQSWYENTDEITRWSYGEYYAGKFIINHNDFNQFYDSSAKNKTVNPYGIDQTYYNEIYKFYEKYYIDEKDKWDEANGELTTSTYYRGTLDGLDINNLWTSYYMGDPNLDATPKSVFVNSLQAYGRNHHYIDKFGYWSNLNYKEGRYLPIKLDTNTSMSADWFNSIVKNLNCDMLSDLSTTEGNQSELGAKAWGGYSFAGFTYVTKNDDGTYTYPYSDMMDMFNSYVNTQIFDPFENILNYATYEDTDGDGVEDKYIIRLFPVYSMGKNLSTTNSKYDKSVTSEYPYYPEGYDSNTIGLYDSYRLKITYDDEDTLPVYDKQRYFYYTYSGEYVSDDNDEDDDDYESIYANATYCTLQNFQLKHNMKTIEFQLANKTYFQSSSKWHMDGYSGDWLTLMTATKDDLNAIFATYGYNIYISLYIFSDNIFGIKQYKNEDATNIDNINKLASESDTIFSSLTNKEISGINVKGKTSCDFNNTSNTTEGVEIVDVSDSEKTTYSYSVRKRSFLFGLEYVRNIKLISNKDTSGTDDESNTSSLASSLKNSYDSARQYSKTIANMAVRYKDNFDSTELETHTVEDKYAYRYIIENVSLVDDAYGTLFNLVYPDPTSTVSQNVIFLPGSYMYARKSDGTYDVDSNNNEPQNKFTQSLLYMYTDTGGYAKEFVSADNYFTSNNASMGDGDTLYWWQDNGDEGKYGLYDFILIKEPLKNVYYVFAYKHTNIFVKIFVNDVEVDDDGFAIHDTNNINSENELLFNSSYYIGDTISGDDSYNLKTLDNIFKSYFEGIGVSDFSNYVIKDHVTKAIVATFENNKVSFQSEFKIRKNYIFYLDKLS